MDEREKIVKVLVERFGIMPENCAALYSYQGIADALIAAGIRDITRQGYICMNGEVIIPTPNIYNKVADLLSCPRIKEREIEEEKGE